MRSMTRTFVALAALSQIWLAQIPFANVALAQEPTAITPETSTVTSAVTSCMMVCNNTSATCQANCATPTIGGALPTSAASCQLACSNSALTCQGICAQRSPSQ